jgi:hypothetical protein
MFRPPRRSSLGQNKNVTGNNSCYISKLIYAFGLTSHWNLYSMRTVVSTINTYTTKTVFTTYCKNCFLLHPYFVLMMTS